MLSRALRLLMLVAAAGLAGAGIGPASAQDDELEAMATALKDTTFTLQDGLKAAERQGQPISAQFEIDDGKLQLSVYTSKRRRLHRNCRRPENGRDRKTGKNHRYRRTQRCGRSKGRDGEGEDLACRRGRYGRKENSGFRAVAVFPDLRDGHAVADVTLLQGTRPRTLPRSWIE